jgi:hypothetical protein
MGIAQGRALREIIRAEVARAGLPTHRSRWPSLRPVVAGPLRGRGPGRELFRHFAHQAERLEGLAQASDLPLDSLVELQLRLELRVGAGGEAGEEAGKEPGWIVRESRPVVGFRSLELTLPWLVPAVAGVNEAGLAVLATLPDGAASASLAGRDGDAPPLLLVQDCLTRFENLAGALDWCRKRPVEGEQTIYFGDASGARATVEIHGRERRVELAPGVGREQVGEAVWLEGRIGGAKSSSSSSETAGDLVRIDPVARRLDVRGVAALASKGGQTFGFEPLAASSAEG